MTLNDSPTAQEAEKPSCLSVALDYIAAGIDCTPIYSPTTKIKDAGKHPKLTEWQQRHLTAEEFTNAYAEGDNVGVITGKRSGIICVDCDVKKGGMDWYRTHEDDFGNCIKENTPSGGIHLYFKYPEGREMVPSKIGLFPGVDFLADGGKQVVTWPSVAKNGKSYTIDNGLCLVDVAFESDGPPPWIIKAADDDYAIRLKKQKESEAVIVPDDAVLDDPLEIARAKETLKNYPAAIEGNYGDYTTMMAAHIGRDHLLSPMTTLRVMKEVYNPRCQPPWDDAGLWAKVKSAYKSAKRPAGSRTVGAMFSDAPVIPEGVAGEGADEPIHSYHNKLPVPSARAFIERHPDRLLCVQGQIYAYNDDATKWDILSDEMCESRIMKDIGTVSPKMCRMLKMDHLSNIRKAIKREIMPSTPTELVADRWADGREGDFVTCKNGILNIGTGELLPHSPSWFSFTALPFAYDPTAQCPEFERFLESIWDNDAQLKRSLQLWFGYVLTSNMKFQRLAILIGKSRGGKGTIARILEALIGKQNVAACSVVGFGAQFGLEHVLGKRLALFSEAKKAAGDKLQVATERIISISGNDAQPIERKYASTLTMALPTKIMILCNRIPPFINDEEALTNRMIAFPFEKSFSGKEDFELEPRLHKELPGILNWAIEGAKAILNGEQLIQSNAGKAKVQEIAEILDSVQGFMADVVEFSSDTNARSVFVTHKALYKAYEQWCKDSNAFPHGKNRFLQEFRGKAAERVSEQRASDASRLKGFYGIKLNMEDVGPFERTGATSSGGYRSQDDDEEIPF